MGLFNKIISCPKCNTPGAEKSLFKVRCLNRLCQHFNIDYATSQSGQVPPVKPSSPKERPNPRLNPREAFALGMIEFTPNLEVRYRNFRGEEKIFNADRSTLRHKNQHISICVAPTARRIALRKDNILNRQELAI